MNDVLLTFDIDWAPDFVINQVARTLIEKRVKATWFVTHRSEAIENLRENKTLFELGIHPNMLAGSTHGTTEDQVLEHITAVVPEATCMRTHGLYQTSNWLTKAAREYGIFVDASLFLPRTPYLRPHQVRWNGMNLWRVPYFWEDDSEMFEEEPIWSATDPRIPVDGLKVYDFHPIHIALNTDRFERYERLKELRPLQEWDEDFIREHSYKGQGPRHLFLELAELLSSGGKKVSELIPFVNP